MEAAAASTDRRKWLALLAVALGIFMVMIDTTIVNVALPEIRADLGYLDISVAELQWVINSYTIALAVFLLTAGKVADMIGRRRVFIIGLLVFIAASVACGLATDINTLIAARTLQGIGAAIVTPTTLSIISATFPPQERGAALGIWSAAVGLGAAIGPLVGGVLTDEGDWSWIFFVNVPIGVLTVVAALAWVRESRDPSEERALDLPGLLVSGVGLFALTFALLQANDYGWGDTRIVGLLVLSAVAFAAVVLVERRQRVPMIELSLFRSSTFTGANVLSAFVGFVLLGIVFYVSLFMQNVMVYTPTETGAALLPMTVLIMLSAAIGGKLTDKIGPRPVLTAGFAILTIALLFLSRLDFDSSFQDLLPGLMLAGVGLGFSLTPLTAAALAGVPVHQAGIGAGVLNALRQAGSALGLAILGAISSEVISASLEEGQTSPEGFIDGFGPLMLFAAGIAAVGALVALVMITRAPIQTPADAPKIPVAAASAIMAIPEGKPSAIMPRFEGAVPDRGAPAPAPPARAPDEPLVAPGGPTLEVVSGPAAGTVIPLGDEPLVIGRAEDGAGTLGDDEELSRRHAKISRAGAGVLIEDLRSTNGTVVDGAKISAPTSVEVGGRITVGSSELRVVAPSEPQPTRARATVEPAAAPPAAAAVNGAALDVMAGPAEGTRIALGPEPFVIGRAEQGDGKLGDDAELSRRHASISRLGDGRLVVEDLGSTNGTHVNDSRIAAPTVVQRGDSIGVGASKLEVRA